MIPQTEFIRGASQFPRKIMTRENVLSKELCHQIKAYCLDGNAGFHRVVNPAPNHWTIKFDTARIPLNSWIDLGSVLDPLWEEAFDFFNFSVTHIEQYEIKRYSPGDLATEHIDHFYGTTGDVERKLTMIIQLSDDGDYRGGDTMLTKIPCNRSLGSMVIFPSFFPHAVQMVTMGARWSLNCWAWGPYWK